jgi:protein associated with RNAse G/E
MDESRNISVRVLKYDGSDYRRWSGEITRRTSSLIQLDAAFSMDAYHPLLGDIPRGTRLIEYYWLDRWYNVLRFLNDDASTKHFYCNITTPPQLEDRVLTYVDLDMDILALPDLSYHVLDLDEFEMNAERYGYPKEVKVNAHAAVEELISLIGARAFPFQSAEEGAR